MNGGEMNNIRTAGVIASFNHEKFVAESVLSLANQVHEIVVVDDCSSDNTADILRALDVPNMKLILHEKNKGVSYSYNEAVSLSRAEVIVIQGGDDKSLPGRVEEHLKSLSSPGTVLSYSQPRVIDAAGQVLPKEAAPEFFSSVDQTKILEHLYFLGNFICAPSVALRKVDYESNRGFNPANSYLQDYELWIKLASFGKFVMSDSPLVEYRKHEKNISRDNLTKSITYTSRFDAEMDYVLGSVVKDFNTSALFALGRYIGLSNRVLESIDSTILLALVQLSHSNVTQVRRGFALLMEIVNSRGELEFLSEFGIDDEKLNEYSRTCDHLNVSSRARLEYRVGNLG